MMPLKLKGFFASVFIFALMAFILFPTVTFSKEFFPFGKRTTIGLFFGRRGLRALFNMLLRPEATWTNFLKLSALCAFFIAMDHGRKTLLTFILFEFVIRGGFR
jgi:hypothetical protein